MVSFWIMKNSQQLNCIVMEGVISFMYEFTSNEYQFEELLQRICGELQISNSQYEEAETSYMAVAKWLSEDKERFPDIDINIYPQGSLRIGTTVHPISQQEFDLDLVCELVLDWSNYEDPVQILELIEERLREHKTYAPMIERKNRCVRLNYKRNFHMDILPACPVNIGEIGGCVKVPDRKASDWKDSNPKGYANWFDKIANDYEKLFKYSTLLEKKAEIDKLPDIEPVEIKPPLKRAVQLIKRYRDIYFEDHPKNAPISIVLTTIFGELYQRQGSVNKTISEVLDRICWMIKDREKIVVKNPTNHLEILSERWDTESEMYENFVKFINDFKQKWDEINDVKDIGFIEVSLKLKEMFGEELINKGLRKQAKFTEAVRQSGNLGVTSGGLLAMAPLAAAKDIDIVKVKRNTFYGN